MTALAVVLAAVAPIPLTPPQQGLVSVQDYPQYALDHGEEGSVATQLVVDPRGRVDSCKVIISSGFADLDATTCRLLTSRARFTPAVGDDGRPIYGLYRSLINWTLDRSKRAALGPDAELTLNQAPPGVSLPADVWVSYIIDPNGRLRNCRAYESAANAYPRLVGLACQELGRNPAEIVRNSSGEPVAAADTVRVRFSANR
jgi:TonB family protein